MIIKLTLLGDEESGGPRERVFDRETIKVGRDATFDLVFAWEQWPMVSRRHAEFRSANGLCVVVDTDSTYGTFVNGQRINKSAEVRPGARVQFGSGGPELIVESVEQPAASRPAHAPAAAGPGEGGLAETYPMSYSATGPRGPDKRTAEKTDPPATPTGAACTPACIEYVSGGEGSPRQRFEVNRDVLRLGREPGMDVMIDAAAAVVSRHHAELRREGGQFVLVDLGSFNGTLLNDKRISAPTRLNDGDLIQLGMGGPVFRFHDPVNVLLARPAVQAAGLEVPPPKPVNGKLPPPNVMGLGTIRVNGTGSLKQPPTPADGDEPQLICEERLAGERLRLTIGRSPDNDIRLDGLQISNHHAQLTIDAGYLLIEDLGSTNGVYINGQRLAGKQYLRPSDVVLIGPFLIKLVGADVKVFDTRSKTRIDAIDITKVVPDRSGSGTITLLDGVTLTIQPNEFVGLLGPSGAGKSTLMDALNGVRPATSGQVLINNLDLYQHLDSLKQSIGYVPQDDIIHRELTVYRTLYYVARLRLSRDVSGQETDQIVNEVMDVTGLSERRDVCISQLSGGQRKRVSIAVELITKPSVIFLDEPTSGLDPATEEKIMKLFRQIAESGRTVILTTHAMENVKLFDKIVVLMRGKLVFYGTPAEALKHFEAESFKDLYDRLEAPIEERVADYGPLPEGDAAGRLRVVKARRERAAEDVADDWKKKFAATPQYSQNVLQPQAGMRREAQSSEPARRRTGVTDSLRQWGILARRYGEVLRRDKVNLLILIGQAPVIAFLTYLVVGSKSPRDFLYFMLALVAVWFGSSISSREIIRERPVYNRERMVNLGLLPYVGSKLLVLSAIVGLQCLLLFSSLKLLHLLGLMSLPGEVVPQLVTMFLTGMVGIAIGLFVSAVVKTSEMATSLVPLILIPQILFSGLVGVPQGLSRVVGSVMPATWSFDELKRLSTLDTLREEGAAPGGSNEGRGLYKNIEDANDRNISRARRDVEKYKADAEAKLKKFEEDMKEYVRKLQVGAYGQQPRPPALEPAPQVPEAEKVTEDLSGYVEFLHPWGDKALNPLVLLLMFLLWAGATLTALRAQDVR